MTISSYDDETLPLGFNSLSSTAGPFPWSCEEDCTLPNEIWEVQHPKHSSADQELQSTHRRNGKDFMDSSALSPDFYNRSDDGVDLSLSIGHSKGTPTCNIDFAIDLAACHEFFPKDFYCEDAGDDDIVSLYGDDIFCSREQDSVQATSSKHDCANSLNEAFERLNQSMARTAESLGHVKLEFELSKNSCPSAITLSSGEDSQQTLPSMSSRISAQMANMSEHARGEWNTGWEQPPASSSSDFSGMTTGGRDLLQTTSNHTTRSSCSVQPQWNTGRTRNSIRALAFALNNSETLSQTSLRSTTSRSVRSLKRNSYSTPCQEQWSNSWEQQNKQSQLQACAATAFPKLLDNNTGTMSVPSKAKLSFNLQKRLKRDLLTGGKGSSHQRTAGMKHTMN